MYREHDLVSRTLLRVEEDVIIIALLHRLDCAVSSSTAKDRLHQAITEVADEKKQRGADQDEAAGFRVLQHDPTIVRVPDVPPILLHMLHTFSDTILV